MANNDSRTIQLVTSILKVIENDIVPLTRRGVESGSKVFGAAILSRSDLSTVMVATNDEQTSPLLHGEINCIQKFFSLPSSGRPLPRGCVFLATHEPCSLCLSGITWAGFNEFYYLFTYEDSRDLFSIPYDIDILQEVFRVRSCNDTSETLESRQLYNKRNKFFESKSVVDLIGEIDDEKERSRLEVEVVRIRDLYKSLSETYQEGKKAGAETSSVWK